MGEVPSIKHALKPKRAVATTRSEEEDDKEDTCSGKGQISVT